MSNYVFTEALRGTRVAAVRAQETSSVCALHVRCAQRILYICPQDEELITNMIKRESICRVKMLSSSHSLCRSLRLNPDHVEGLK